MFVPQFIILDQLSRPYFENDVINSDDKKKLTKAFEIIDGFISKVNSQGNSFQIIVLEHAPKSIWEDAYLKNIKLVEEFKDGNALIQNL